MRRIATIGALVTGAAIAIPRAADPPAIRLIDVAEQAGVTVLDISGDATKDYIIDSMGSGAAWFDYDNDGDLDLLIVNGSTRDNMKRGGDQMLTLYENDGNGHFSDVTAKRWRTGMVKRP